MILLLKSFKMCVCISAAEATEAVEQVRGMCLGDDETLRLTNETNIL